MKTLVLALSLCLCSTGFADFNFPDAAFGGTDTVVTTTPPSVVCRGGQCYVPRATSCPNGQCTIQQPRVVYQQPQTYRPRQVAMAAGVRGVDPGGPLTGQQAAEIKARYMAQRRMGGHPRMDLNRRIAGGYSFEGTGWTSGGGQAPTCTPRRRMQLIGDATAVNGNRKYRVRIWR